MDVCVSRFEHPMGVSKGQRSLRPDQAQYVGKQDSPMPCSKTHRRDAILRIVTCHVTLQPEKMRGKIQS